MEKHEALPAIEMKFTDPADVEKFGEDWYTYDEKSLITRPARELMVMEHALGIGLFDVMNGVRARTVLGDTAAAWIAVREKDPELAGDFNEFNPVTMLIIWRGKGKAPAAPEDLPDPELTPKPLESEATSETSETTPPVILHALPETE
jgi:hypothetical protein